MLTLNGYGKKLPQMKSSHAEDIAEHVWKPLIALAVVSVAAIYAPLNFDSSVSRTVLYGGGHHAQSNPTMLGSHLHTGAMACKPLTGRSADYRMPSLLLIGKFAAA